MSSEIGVTHRPTLRQILAAIAGLTFFSATLWLVISIADRLAALVGL